MGSNDDVPINEDDGRRVAEAIAATSSVAGELVRDHEAEHGEILPTLLLDEIGQWFVDTLGRDANACRAVDAVSELYETGDDDIQTIVVTGFLEAMPHVGHTGREVVDQLSGALRAELRGMENRTPN
ncbi:hypothetical protein Acsp06_20580 [Actinomycetospora sp. NBRC 106375]|uniref:DUF7674 family protein n=1 Tax=Actinomycetospora sp. NBRC 106375 TaxID=3032207 RepID=UPI0024A2AFF0|nr:hypothetical protein [Actinomycetospora sp. NBRC 106375]GLZ45873.1 hypothetical protein Acsp06_20580 [Actinomycetospora sp. NBRC 106375]